MYNQNEVSRLPTTYVVFAGGAHLLMYTYVELHVKLICNVPNCTVFSKWNKIIEIAFIFKLFHWLWQNSSLFNTPFRDLLVLRRVYWFRLVYLPRKFFLSTITWQFIEVSRRNLDQKSILKNVEALWFWEGWCCAEMFVKNKH